ncbi:hypothetical protein DFP72DRAFT_1170998 [Ephemerocybe angulata]|uniref:Class II Histidinyl-tRNA synthetase (HisRS)-like catalytic core domain-containing protein n=1 Tax=Ephemerocybe angulata TaxID=980116 RepID=A0A8H6HVR0_9AGAR|nr:hypothetical protein DFP72DRAFT_1170998 [Tulosesus angulatus]
MLSLLCTVLTRLEVGESTIKLNNRKILDGMTLDKAPWSEVKREMTEEKCLDPLVADKIGEYVKLKGGEDLIQTLVADATLMDNKRAKEGVSEMEILFRLLKAYQVTDRFSFDLSLARGLDYYTGQHFATGPATTTPTPEAATPAPKRKAVKKEAKDELEIDESTVGIGSIAAGGRYDNLVTTIVAGANGVLPGTKLPNVPCIGVSIEMDRIFALVWPKWVEKSVRAKEMFVYVMSAGDGLLEEWIGLVRELREAGVKTDFLAKTKPKLSAQFAAGEKDEEQRWVVEGRKTVKVESADKGTKVRRSELAEWLKATGAWAERETREWAYAFATWIFSIFSKFVPVRFSKVPDDFGSCIRQGVRPSKVWLIDVICSSGGHSTPVFIEGFSRSEGLPEFAIEPAVKQAPTELPATDQ